MAGPDYNIGPHIQAQDARHGFRPWVNFEALAQDPPLVITRGEGARLFDAEGRSYLDAVGGLWCTNIGLGREEMAQAIAEQARDLAYSSTFTDMTNMPSSRLAAQIAARTPGDLNRVHFTTGGSTAVDSAYRLTQFYQRCRGRPDKTHVIARKQSYHGSTFATISIGNRYGDRVPEFTYMKQGVSHISAPDLYRRPDGMDEATFGAQLVDEFTQEVARVGADRVGAFFAEPIMGSGGVLVPTLGYLPGIAEVCRAHDILFVADEVVTGWGRLGHWFSCREVFGVQPDIITTAKGLSSGYVPIGAMIYSDRVHEVISGGGADRWYPSGYTYAGHPVACAAALKNIEILERENLLQNAAEVGAYFGQCLRTLIDLPLVGDVRGMGMMWAVELVADKSSKALHPEALNVGKRIADKAEARGLIVRPMGHLNVMSPPLIITRSDAEFIARTLGAAIEEVSAQLPEM